MAAARDAMSLTLSQVRNQVRSQVLSLAVRR